MHVCLCMYVCMLYMPVCMYVCDVVVFTTEFSEGNTGVESAVLSSARVAYTTPTHELLARLSSNWRDLIVTTAMADVLTTRVSKGDTHIAW